MLMNDLDRARKLILELNQAVRQHEQVSGMPVMAASVHNAGIFRSKGKTRLFLNRKRIEIRPQRDRLARLAALNRDDKAVPVSDSVSSFTSLP